MKKEVRVIMPNGATKDFETKRECAQFVKEYLNVDNKGSGIERKLQEEISEYEGLKFKY